MKRLLAVTAIAAAFGSGFAATPASADPCSGKIDLACGGECPSDYPCTPMICLVYYSPRCVV